MWKVADGLFLGTIEDAEDVTSLRSLGVSYVVNCAKELPSSHENELIYLRLNLKDPDSGLMECLDAACEFIDNGRRSGGVLVFCQGAISRSPSVVLGYLCHGGSKLEEAVRELATVCQTRPNGVFLDQVAMHFENRSLSDKELQNLIRQLSHEM
ncbi:dual specificity protein phosphatase family protein [Aeoliella sp.]|uniref:dual specificity protein phosphatase family protein n=1 Tax=Aeoliella sp. TaxID=2795800 RepID=UPI003CCC192B